MTDAQLALAPASDFKSRLEYARLDDLPPDRQLPSPAPTPALTNSMADAGLWVPIILVEGKQGYRVLAGRRRIKAARKLKWKEIRAVVYDDLPGVEASIVTAVENGGGRSDNPLSDLEVILPLAKTYSPKQIARVTGLPVAVVEKRLKLASLDPAIVDAIVAGRLAMGTAEQIAALGPARQDLVLGKLRALPEGKKLTAEMVREARQAEAAQVLGAIVTAPGLDLTVEFTPSSPAPEKFVVLPPWTVLYDTLEEARANAGGQPVYRLKEAS